MSFEKDDPEWADYVSDDRDNQTSTVLDFIKDRRLKKLSLEPKPGIGKTEAEIIAALFIRKSWKNWKKVQLVFAAPNHELCSEIVERLYDKGVSEVTHIWGKEHFCNFAPDHYSHECKMCPHHDTCGYHDQNWDDYCIVMPFQLTQMLKGSPKKFRILIYDECPFQIWIPSQILKNLDDIDLGHGTPIIREGKNYTEYFDCKLSKTFVADNTYKYSIKSIFGIGGRILKREADPAHNIKERYILFGQNQDMFGKRYHKIIYSSATTPFSIRSKMIDGDWVRFKGDTQEQNPVIPIGRFGGLKQQEDNLENFKGKIDHIMSEWKRIYGRDMKVFISTRQKTQKLMESWTEKNNIDVVHYNQLGTNDFNNKYDLIITYGKMTFDLMSKQIYSYYLTVNEIKSLEDSVVIQALHRARLVLHRDTPVLLVKTNDGVMNNNAHIRYTADSFLSLQNFPFKRNYTVNQIKTQCGCSISIARTYKVYLNHINEVLFGGVITVAAMLQEGYGEEDIISELGISRRTFYKEKKRLKTDSCLLKFGENK